jgi:NitT/TauT family transport system ATP-binding protein
MTSSHERQSDALGKGSLSRGARLGLHGVGKSYATANGNVEALAACSLDIAATEFVALVGPSGCGKSTLLNIVAGFDGPSAGRVTLGDTVLATPEKPARPGSDRVVVFQHGALFPWMTVADNVAYGLIRQGVADKVAARDRAIAFLGECGGLDRVADSYPAQLSAGMQRRVEIARALINDPAVLLLDEPFRAMDTVTKSRMHGHLLDLHYRFPKTVLFITHDLDEAILLADRVCVMSTRPGRIRMTTTIDLPRPREPRMIASEAFQKAKRETVEIVHEEARKAFERGERELA